MMSTFCVNSRGVTCSVGAQHDISQIAKGKARRRGIGSALLIFRIAVPNIDSRRVDAMVTESFVERLFCNGACAADVDENRTLRK